MEKIRGQPRMRLPSENARRAGGDWFVAGVEPAAVAAGLRVNYRMTLSTTWTMPFDAKRLVLTISAPPMPT